MKTLPQIQRNRRSFVLKTLLLGLCLALSACARGTTADPIAAGNAQISVERSRLIELCENFLRDFVQLIPINAARSGKPIEIDISEESRQRQRLLYSTYLKKLSAIDREKLPIHDRLPYDLIKHDLTMHLEALRSNDYLVPNLRRSRSLLAGIYAGDREYSVRTDPNSPNDVNYYNAYLKLLQSVPSEVDTIIANMRKGLTLGVVDSEYVTERTLLQVDQVSGWNVEQNPYYQPLFEMPPSISNLNRIRITKEATQVIQDAIIPSYKKLGAFIRQEYLPKTRHSLPGMSGLPDGQSRYAQLVKSLTQTNLTPDDIFELVMDELKRVINQVEELEEKLGFKGNRDGFAAFLKDNQPKEYTSAEDLIKAYEALGRQIAPRLPQLFARLPMGSYVIRLAVTEFDGIYRPALNSSSPGVFYVGVTDIATIRRSVNVPLFLHEAVPGHHLQKGLELDHAFFPQLQNVQSYDAFVEGWAFYAMGLGHELGLYKDPIQHYHFLIGRILQAENLLLDVGIHHKGWNIAEVSLFFPDAAARPSLINIITQPGRRVANQMGRFKISAIRAKAEKTLGSKFDIRVFHDELLKDGALPLDFLESKMNMWIDRQSR